MIEVRNVEKKYGSHIAVQDLSFDVEQHQVFGLLGKNGAGKSTTMNMLTGYIAPTKGTIRIGGYDMETEPMQAKGLIGYLPELPPLYPELTPEEYLQFVAQAKGVDKTKIREQIDMAMERTQITDVRKRLIRSLSKGYRQRVGMAQAILGDPELIIFDEPTVGLDPVQLIEFRKMIRELGNNHTIVISSHILAEIAEICDRVMIMAQGKLLAIDTPERLAAKIGEKPDLPLEEIFLKLTEEV